MRSIFNIDAGDAKHKNNQIPFEIFVLFFFYQNVSRSFRKLTNSHLISRRRTRLFLDKNPSRSMFEAVYTNFTRAVFPLIKSGWRLKSNAKPVRIGWEPESIWTFLVYSSSLYNRTNSDASIQTVNTGFACRPECLNSVRIHWFVIQKQISDKKDEVDVLEWLLNQWKIILLSNRENSAKIHLDVMMTPRSSKRMWRRFDRKKFYGIEMFYLNLMFLRITSNNLC